jgi:hypothetical protein
MPGMPMPGADTGMRMGMGMLIGHALAALACAWWLRRGEAALHAVLRTAARWVITHLAVPAPVASVPVRDATLVLRVEPIGPAPRSQWLRSSRVLRGPPIAPSSR